MSSSLRVGTAALALALLGPGLAAAAPGVGTSVGDDPDADVLAVLDRAVDAARTTRYRGRVTVASFGRGGPQVTTVDVTRRADGRLQVQRRGAWELRRDGDGSTLRSSRTGELLRLGGVEPRAFDRDRFLARYTVADGGRTVLDTGPARTLLVTGRDDGVRHETLHVDEASGLVVRRETRDGDGQAVRTVAFTELEVLADDAVLPEPPSLDETGAVRLALTPVGRETLVERGVPAEPELPGGWELVAAAEVTDGDAPTVHLVYGDGLYTLSLYVQPGRLAATVTDGATALDVPGAGVVWRLPGSEPRRIVWTGGGRTFTALTDAPTGDLLVAVAGLPNDPAPSTLRRLARGLHRVGDRLLPPWG